MKIAMVASSASRAAGGIYEVERRLSLELSVARSHKVGIFAGVDAQTKVDLPAWLPLEPKVYPVFGPSSFGYCPGMAAGLYAWNADVAHLHMLWMYPSIAINQWATKYEKPYVITLHGMLDSWAIAHSSWKKKLALMCYERRNLEGAACIHVLSEEEASSARNFGLKNPLAVIPNGIDLPELTYGEVNGRKTKHHLLFLGRLHPKKGLLNLIRSWNEIQQSGQGKDWVLTICGWPELEHDQELKKLAGELGLPFAVSACLDNENQDVSLQFLGPQFGSEKERCLQSCDAFVLPSFSEGLPMSVLEAWAYGKPVVMTPMCNLPEGFVVNAAIQVLPDVPSLKDGLLKLISMMDIEREAMGESGLELVKTRFTWESVGLKIEEVYGWLLKGGTPPPFVHLESELQYKS